MARILKNVVIWHVSSRWEEENVQYTALQKIADLNSHNAVSLLASPAILAKRSKTHSDFDAVANMELSNCKMMFQLHIPKLMLVLGSGVANLFWALVK